MVINMGPQHPSTHGVLRLVLEIDGETVVSLAPDIGYLHTGIEKTCEAKFYQQVVPLTDRIDYLCPMTNNLAYCLAVEKLLGLEIPERAQYLRVLLQRAHPHPVAPGLAGHARHGHRRAHRLPLLLPRARRDAAHLRGRQRPAHDDQLLPHRRRQPGAAAGSLSTRFATSSTTSRRRSTSTRTCCNGNPIWIGRLKGVGYLSPEDAIALGVTGPPLRASGVDWDLRRDMPYSGYEKFQFKVPVSNDGDVWARYVVRMQEMRESVKICQQALDGMPEGRIVADAPKIILPDREQMKTQMESLIHHFKIVTEGFACPGRRGLPVRRSAARRDGLLRRLRRHRQALSRAHAQPGLRHPAGAGDDVQGPAARGRRRRDRLDRHRAGRD